MNNLYVISVNHETHSSSDRINLSLSDVHRQQLFAFLTYNLNVDGYVHISTCNRLEIYYEADANHNTSIIDKWISLAEKNNIAQQSFQTFEGSKNSIDHVLALSAGLKSAIKGDDQILSQLKTSFEYARKSGSLSTLLERAYQTVMRFHKQICKETEYKSHTVSLAYQALKTIRSKFDSKLLKSKRVLIIGAGDMATQVVKYIGKFQYAQVDITNRTWHKAELLALNKNITAIPYESLDIARYDVIISCTDQGYHLVKDWSGIQFYIDLSIHSALFTSIPVPHVLLHQLQQTIETHNSSRMESIKSVEQILQTKSVEYLAWVDAWISRKATHTV